MRKFNFNVNPVDSLLVLADRGNKILRQMAKYGASDKVQFEFMSGQLDKVQQEMHEVNEFMNGLADCDLEMYKNTSLLECCKMDKTDLGAVSVVLHAIDNLGDLATTDEYLIKTLSSNECESRLRRRFAVRNVYYNHKDRFPKEDSADVLSTVCLSSDVSDLPSASAKFADYYGLGVREMLFLHLFRYLEML